MLIKIKHEILEDNNIYLNSFELKKDYY